VNSVRNGLDPLSSDGKVYIFDTTLRDGEQTPGVALTPDEKVEIARQLDKLGVDVIEAGFPASSEGEFEGVRKVSSLGLRSRVAALARSVRGDVDRALAAGVDRIHVFIATSDVHLQYKLKMSREDALASAVDAVSYAKSHGVEVEFSAEDATRTDPQFLRTVFSEVAAAGADVLDIPDTVGVATPERIAELVRLTKEAAPGKIISVHCHDDFGLAVANSVSGVLAGAQQFHATINGIGERAGNASLEEAALVLKFLYGKSVGIKPELIYETSRLVARLTGIYPPPNKALVGDNAFGHESGIHVHGVLEMPSTYEPISPEVVGRRRFFVAGKHAGSHGIEAMLREYGIDVNEEQLRQIVREVKRLGDMGKTVTDADLLAIARSVLGKLPAGEAAVSLTGLVVVTGMGVSPTASVRIRLKDRDVDTSSVGVGPVDAALRAIQSVVREIADVRLVEYRLEAITGGSDALGEVVVKVEDDLGNMASARSVGTDIVMASVDAMVDGINKILQKRQAGATGNVRVQDSGNRG
jgi:2-isopropylmalate synthase